LPAVLCIQTITGAHDGAIWCADFSSDGAYLATGGKDATVRIWLVAGLPASLRILLPTLPPKPADPYDRTDTGPRAFLEPEPVRVFVDHASEILDLAWSPKGHSLLTSSMDKTVRLWSLATGECVRVFDHPDFVTSVSFHPRNGRIFLSGSLDNKLRLWSLREARVVSFSDVRGFITCVSFSADGSAAMAGTYDGKCTFFSVEPSGSLAWQTQVHVRSTRGKNSVGKKLTGIVPLANGTAVLITSNDSRLRLYRTNDYSLACKFRGGTNNSLQIRATLAPSNEKVVCGSETGQICVWRVPTDPRAARQAFRGVAGAGVGSAAKLLSSVSRSAAEAAKHGASRPFKLRSSSGSQHARPSADSDDDTPPPPPPPLSLTPSPSLSLPPSSTSKGTSTLDSRRDRQDVHEWLVATHGRPIVVALFVPTRYLADSLSLSLPNEQSVLGVTIVGDLRVYLTQTRLRDT
jgi:WD40 repeat protein